MEPEISALWNIKGKVGHEQERIVLKILLVKQKKHSYLSMEREKKQNKAKAIKGLLEPAHSYRGLSLYWFLGLAEYRYSWIQFMWFFKTYRINFFYFGVSCVIRKCVHSSRWESEKSRCAVLSMWVFELSSKLILTFTMWGRGVTRETISLHGPQCNFRLRNTTSIHNRQLPSTSASQQYLIHNFQHEWAKKEEHWGKRSPETGAFRPNGKVGIRVLNSN